MSRVVARYQRFTYNLTSSVLCNSKCRKWWILSILNKKWVIWPRPPDKMTFRQKHHFSNCLWTNDLFLTPDNLLINNRKAQTTPTPRILPSSQAESNLFYKNLAKKNRKKRYIKLSVMPMTTLIICKLWNSLKKLSTKKK